MDKRLLARVEQQAWFHRYPRGLPVLIFALSAAATALSVLAIERADAKARGLELDSSATEIAYALQRRASENLAYLSAAASVFSTRDGVSPLAFGTLVKDLNSGHAARGALGMGWARWIAPGEVPALEAELRAAGVPQYRVTPPPRAGQTWLSPIAYLEPRSPANTAALGFDMYSETVRRAAMDKAMRLGKPVLSGKVHLVQDASKPGVAGFLIYIPVYGNPATRSNLKGFVYSPFRAQEFLNAATELTSGARMDIAVFDETGSPENLLAEQSFPGETGVRRERHIEVGNHRWLLVVTDKRARTLAPLSLATLFFGMTIAILLMALARLITRRAAEDRQVLEWLSGQAAIRTSLTRELNHRVKNTLANVLSIIALTKRRSASIDEFADSLNGRIRALSATHDLLSQSEWSNAPVGEVVRSEVAPYMDASDNHIHVQGPDISLAPNDALSLGLAIHELATNAAKYGALSTPDGKVHITWRLMTPDLAELHWREEGGPPVAPPTRRGFGTDLIEKVVAHELHTAVDLRFEPGGVECTLRMPVRTRNEFALRHPG